MIGVQNLMKKHQALQAELAGHEPRINNVSQQGAEMIKDGHFATGEIQDKITELEDRWQALKVGMFENCREVSGEIKSSFIRRHYLFQV